MRIKVFRFYVFLLFCTFFFKLTLWTNIEFLPKIWDPIFKTDFPKPFFCFLLIAQNCLEICVNCAWNCVTPLFTPLEVQFSKKKKFKNVLLPHLKCSVTFESYRWEESWIFLIRGLKITILRKVSGCLAFSRKWVGNHFYMATWTLMYWCSAVMPE